MDPCGRGTILSKGLVGKLSFQYHLRALWEDKPVKEVSGAG